MQKKTKKKVNIKFQMDMPVNESIENELISVDNNFYSINTVSMCGTTRFRIPKDITKTLQLETGDNFIIVRYEYDSEYHLIFKKEIKIQNKQCYKRKLITAGRISILYGCIPTQILKQIPNIQYIILQHPDTFDSYEWIISFHTT